MAGNNVIQFPSGNGGGSGFGQAFGPSSNGAAAQQAPPQAGAPVQAPPMIEQILARLGSTLQLARGATVRLVSRAVPGTIEQGLFNQYGLIQNNLAQLGARAAQSPSNEELAAIGQDLEGIEKATNEYVAAVNTALANTPVVTVDSKKMWWIGGGVAVAALATTLWLVLRKPSRRRKIAGLLGLSAPAAIGSGESRPRRKARKLKK